MHCLSLTGHDKHIKYNTRFTRKCSNEHKADESVQRFTYLAKVLNFLGQIFNIYYM